MQAWNTVALWMVWVAQWLCERRMAVLMVFPAFMLPVCVIKSVILFNRGQRIDKDVSPRTLN